MFAIIDYGMGNLKSVANAFSFLGQEVRLVKDPAEIDGARAIILPGVGAFGQAMENLRRLKLVDALNEHVLVRKVPFLGICLGMQLVAQTSEELGTHEGLGWIKGHVKRVGVKEGTRLPHIGWNDIKVCTPDPLFSRISHDRNFYFVHSFHIECDDVFISAKCHYDVDVTAAIQKENIFATQFHPEKSQENGLRLLRRFIEYADESARARQVRVC
jgi:glutamine amidotransferase